MSCRQKFVDEMSCRRNVLSTKCLSTKVCRQNVSTKILSTKCFSTQVSFDQRHRIPSILWKYNTNIVRHRRLRKYVKYSLLDITNIFLRLWTYCKDIFLDKKSFSMIKSNHSFIWIIRLSFISIKYFLSNFSFTHFHSN
jgi:hypothetical protein